MNGIIINDCRDANAKGRQCARVSELLNIPVSFVGVSSDIEASGNVVDMIDAFEGKEGVILVNVAPRNGVAKKFQNGTPFCYFYVGKTLVISSIAGYTLSLIKKLGLTEELHLCPPETIFDDLGILDKKDTQFRSFELTPKIAQALLSGKKLKTQPISISEIPDLPNCVWWIDCFGNAKTSILDGETEALFVDGKEIKRFPRLKDVPDKQTATIVGSSGFGDKRFLEIVINGASASSVFSLESGKLL